MKTMHRNRPLVTLVLAAAMIAVLGTVTVTASAHERTGHATESSRIRRPLIGACSGEPDGSGSNVAPPKTMVSGGLPGGMTLQQWIYWTFRVWIAQQKLRG